MMDKKKKNRIEKHIKALEKSYDNVITVLQEEVKKDKDGKVKLKDTQKRLFSEGIKTAAETATYLLDLINQKQAELDGVMSEGEGEKPNVEPSPKVVKTNENHPLAKHLG